MSLITALVIIYDAYKLTSYQKSSKKILMAARTAAQDFTITPLKAAKAAKDEAPNSFIFYAQIILSAVVSLALSHLELKKKINQENHFDAFCSQSQTIYQAEVF